MFKSFLLIFLIFISFSLWFYTSDKYIFHNDKPKKADPLIMQNNNDTSLELKEITEKDNIKINTELSSLKVEDLCNINIIKSLQKIPSFNEKSQWGNKEILDNYNDIDSSEELAYPIIINSKFESWYPNSNMGTFPLLSYWEYKDIWDKIDYSIYNDPLKQEIMIPNYDFKTNSNISKVLLKKDTNECIVSYNIDINKYEENTQEKIDKNLLKDYKYDFIIFKIDDLRNFYPVIDSYNNFINKLSTENKTIEYKKNEYKKIIEDQNN